MTLQQFYVYKELSFDAFCKAVIRNENMDQKRLLAKRASHEVNLSALTNEELAKLQQADLYCPEVITFWVQGNHVQITDWALGQALRSLPPQKRDVILLSYFLDQSDSQIAKLLKMSSRTVCYRRGAALERLKLLLEGLEYENR